LLAFFRAAAVPPVPPSNRGGEVCLLNPILDLIEKARTKLLEVGSGSRGIGVLGLEVGEDLGVLAVAEPPVVVRNRFFVKCPRDTTTLGDRRIHRPGEYRLGQRRE
jgi:hypothetical protein